MSYVIAVSGAQNTGKTTLLNELGLFDYNIDSLKVSRAVQAELNVTVAEIKSKLDLAMDFQQAVFARKRKHDYALSRRDDNDIIFVERSFADIVAYTLHWLQGRVNRNWMDEYIRDCEEAQDIYSGIIFIPPNPAVKFVEDPNRAAKEDVTPIDDHLQVMLKDEANICTITTSRLNERVAQVQDFIKQLQTKNDNKAKTNQVRAWHRLGN